MNQQDLITIVKTNTLPRNTRLNALDEILNCPAPGALKKLLGDDRIQNLITFDIHENGTESQFFWLIYKAFDLGDEDANR